MDTSQINVEMWPSQCVIWQKLCKWRWYVKPGVNIRDHWVSWRVIGVFCTMHAFCALPAPSAHTPVQTHFGAAECKVNEGEDKGGGGQSQIRWFLTRPVVIKAKGCKVGQASSNKRTVSETDTSTSASGEKKNTLQKKKGLSFGSLKKPL